MRCWRALITVICSLSCLASCGSRVKTPSIVAVSGTVRYQGKPLQGAQVSFMTQGASRAATGVTNERGVFVLATFGKSDGAIPGEHRVTISLFRLPEFQLKTYGDSSAYAKARQEAADSGRAVKAESLIPERYSIADKSGLTAYVEIGKKNVFDFELTD